MRVFLDLCMSALMGTISFTMFLISFDGTFAPDKPLDHAMTVCLGAVFALSAILHAMDK